MRNAVRFVVVVGALLAGLALAPAASAIPPNCDPVDPECGGGGGSWIERGTRNLNVTKSAGTVTGEGINCGTDCSDSQPVSHSCEEFDCAPWPDATVWNLTATGGPSGYAALWPSSTGCAVGSTCAVSVGDAETGSASRTVHVDWRDVTKPATPSFNPPSRIGPSSAYAVTAAASDNSGSIFRYFWRVDGVQQAATGSSLSLASFAHGSHTVRVQAQDAAGNTSDAVERTVAIDKVVTVTPGAVPALTKAATVPLAFTTDPDVVSRSCSLNGATGVSCASGWSGVTAASPDGDYTYTVKVTDDVGNVATSAPRAFTIDRTAPALAFTDGPTEGQQVVTTSATIRFSQAEAHPGGVVCKLDGTVVACAPGSPVTLENLTEGQHAFTVTATDGASNQSTITRTFAVQLPDTDPGDENPDDGATPPPPPPPGGDTGAGPGTTPGGGPITGGGSLSPFDPPITYSYVRRGRTTRFTALRIKGLPADAKILVTCKGKGCAKKRKAVRHRGGSVNVLKALKRLRLKPRAVLQMRITAADGDVKLGRWVIRSGKAPKFSVRCAPTGGKLASC